MKLKYSVLLFCAVAWLTGCSQRTSYQQIRVDGTALSQRNATVIVYSTEFQAFNQYPLEIDGKFVDDVTADHPLKLMIQPGVHTFAAPVMGIESTVTERVVKAATVYYFHIVRECRQNMDVVHVEPSEPIHSYYIRRYQPE